MSMPRHHRCFSFEKRTLLGHDGHRRLVAYFRHELHMTYTHLSFLVVTGDILDYW